MICKTGIPRLFCSIILACSLAATSATILADNILRLATTTSTENSGLLSILIPEFEAKSNITVHTIVGGTGRALNHARNGDVDVVLVHAKSSEMELVENGYGVNRNEIMYNEFVIVGPEDDPAGIMGLIDLGEALLKISVTQSNFISRGDDSGTHKKEIALWDSIGIEPNGDWYKEVGLGMGKALQIADELRAYVLSDKGTWLYLRERLSLPIQVEGTADGKNIYGVIAVNPERHPQVNFAAADQFIHWLTSAEAKQLISDYRVNGEQLFYTID